MCRLKNFWVVLLSIFVLGFFQSAGAQTTTYPVNVNVTGLGVGKSVVLLNNKGNPKIVSADGSYSFSTQIAAGGAYAVTVGVQPGGQICAVQSPSSGAIASAPVTVNVTCSASYSVGGSVSNLTSAGLALRLTNTNTGATSNLPIAAGAASYRGYLGFTSGSGYAVTVLSQPVGQVCKVVGGAGTVASANVTTASVDCGFVVSVAVTNIQAATVTITGSSAYPPSNSSVSTASIALFNAVTGDNVSLSAAKDGYDCSVNPATINPITGDATPTVSCSLKTYQLNVAKQGVGTGTVASSPAGIDCGSVCSASFDHGTMVTLTATPDPVSSILGTAAQPGWAGDVPAACQVLPAPTTCTVTMEAAKSVTANFALKRYTINVSNPSGASVQITGSNVQPVLNSPNPTTATSITFTARHNDPVVLSAVKTGYNCSVDTTPASINPITSNATATVNCTLKTYTIAVTNSSGADVSIAGSTAANPTNPNNATSFNFSAKHNDPVVLSAVKTGYNCSVDTNPASINPITGDATATVSCTLKSYTVAVTTAGTGTGTVTSTPAGISCGSTCSSSFDYGTSVTLTAVADAGSTFVGWSGADAGSCSVTTCTFSSLAAAKAVTATFDVASVSLTVGGNLSGLGSGKTIKLSLTKTPVATMFNTEAGVSVNFADPNFQTSDNPGSEFTAGWSFTLASSRVMTHLGVWSGGGLSGNVDLGLWDGSGNLLSSISLLNANIATYGLENEFSYAALPTSVLLGAGTYTVGGFYSGGVLAGYGAPVTPINGLSYAMPSLVDFGVALAQPTFDLSGANPDGYFGPNLRFLTGAAIGTPEVITLSVNGPFTFSTALVAGDTYVADVVEQPVDQLCSIVSGNGTMGSSPVTTVDVSCSDIVSSSSSSSVASSSSSSAISSSSSSADSSSSSSAASSASSSAISSSSSSVASSSSSSAISSSSSSAASSSSSALTLGGSVSGLGSGKTVKLTKNIVSMANTEAGVSVNFADPNFTVTDNSGAEYTVGWSFTLASSRVMTHLGVWSAGGLYGNVDLGLWDGSGNLMSSISLLNANIATYGLENDFSYAKLPTSILLGPGTYTMGGFYSGGVLAGYGAAVTPINGLSYAMPSLVDFSLALAQPTTNFSGVFANGIFGPNLRFLTGAASTTGEEITVSADGVFTFPTALTTGDAYVVEVTAQPVDQLCSIVNGNGTMGSAAVTNVLVTCVDTATGSSSSSAASSSSSASPTEPTVAPTTVIPVDAVVVYSDAVVTTGFDSCPNWGQATVCSPEQTIAGNKVLKYSNLNYQGLDWFNNPINVSAKGKLNVVFWKKDMKRINLSLISFGPVENAYTQVLTTGGWNSVDIPLSNYNADKSAIRQIKLVASGSGTVYVDNIYFYGSPPVDSVPTDAPSTVVPGDAVVVYSDAAVTTGFDSCPNWGQATVCSPEQTIAGNKVLKYSNLNYQGLAWSSIDVSTKTTMHVDLWTPGLTNIQISLISAGTENPVLQLLAPGSWTNVDIPLSSFIANKSAIIQIKLEATGGGTVYVDNIYFYGGSSSSSSSSVASSSSSSADSSASSSVASSSSSSSSSVATYSITVPVSGNVDTVTVTNNALDPQTVVADTGSGGVATFAGLLDGENYLIETTQPLGQTCLVFNGSGTITGADVTIASVSCTSNPYTLGVTLSGVPVGTATTPLASYLIIQDQDLNTRAVVYGSGNPVTGTGNVTFGTPADWASQLPVTNNSLVVNAGNLYLVNYGGGVQCTVGTTAPTGTTVGLPQVIAAIEQPVDPVGTSLTPCTTTVNLTYVGPYSGTTAATYTPFTYTIGESYTLTITSNPTNATCTLNDGVNPAKGIGQAYTSTFGAGNVFVPVSCQYAGATLSGTISGYGTPNTAIVGGVQIEATAQWAACATAGTCTLTTVTPTAGGTLNDIQPGFQVWVDGNATVGAVTLTNGGMGLSLNTFVGAGYVPGNATIPITTTTSMAATTNQNLVFTGGGVSTYYGMKLTVTGTAVDDTPISYTTDALAANATTLTIPTTYLFKAGTSYNVTISTTPQYPAGSERTCTVYNGSGVVPTGTDSTPVINNLVVDCGLNTANSRLLVGSATQVQTTALLGATPTAPTLPGGAAYSLVTFPDLKSFNSIFATNGNYLAYVLNSPASGTGSLALLQVSAAGATTAPTATAPAVQTLPLGNNPYGVAVSSGVVIATNTTDNNMTVATNTGPGTMTLVGNTTIGTGSSAPRGVAFHPSNGFAYVVASGSNAVYPFTINMGATALADKASATSIATGATPYNIAVDSSGRFAYVTNYGAQTISMYKICQFTTTNCVRGTLSSLGTVSVPTANPEHIVADASSVLVTTAGGDVYHYAINSSTGALTQTANSVTVGTPVTGIKLGNARDVFYVTNGGVTPYSYSSSGIGVIGTPLGGAAAAVNLR